MSENQTNNGQIIYQNNNNNMPPKKTGTKVFLVITCVVFVICLIVSAFWFATQTPFRRDWWYARIDEINSPWIRMGLNRGPIFFGYNDDYYDYDNYYGSNYQDSLSDLDDRYAEKFESLREGDALATSSQEERKAEIEEQYLDKINALREQQNDELDAAGNYSAEEYSALTQKYLAEIEKVEQWRNDEIAKIETGGSTSINGNNSDYDQAYAKLNDEYEKEKQALYEEYYGESSGEEFNGVGIKNGESIFSESYPAKSISNIDLNMVTVDLNIIESNDDKIHVDVIARASLSGKYKYSLETSGGTIKFKQKAYKGIMIGMGDFVDMQIAIPKGYSPALDVDTVSGRTDIVSPAFSNISINTVSGRINVESDCPRIKASAVSGNIKVKLTNAESINLNTVSGRITAETNFLTPDINLDTVSGSLEVYVPKAASFDYDLSSISGSKTVFGHKGNSGIGKDLRGSENGGNGGKIKMNSVSGSCTVIATP